MRKWGVFMVALSLSYFGFVTWSAIHQFKDTSLPELETDEATTEARLNRFANSKVLPEGGAADLIEMKEQQKWRSRAILRAKYNLDRKALWVLILGSIFIIFRMFSLGMINLKKRGPQNQNPEFDITDFSAREEYVDEWDLKRKLEDGFVTREEALQWMSKDPLLTCDYCGAKLRSTFSGTRESLEFVTYYKKVPSGAKDMRIVLGSRWYAKAATELKCSGCERVVTR